MSATTDATCIDELHYELIVPANTNYRPNANAKWNRDECTITVEGGRIVAELHQPLMTEEQARPIVESYLNSWRIESGLRFGRVTFEYRFLNSTTRTATISGESTVIVGVPVARATAQALAPALRFDNAPFPDPPVNFVASPDVEMLWTRWRAYRDDREPLSSMAYWALSVLEQAGGRSVASKHYGISRPILDQLGRLSSRIGMPARARKLAGDLDRRDLTAQEETWMQAAIVRIIQRVGECAANLDTPLSVVTNRELPPIDGVETE